MEGIGAFVVNKSIELVGDLLLNYLINLVKNGLPERQYSIKKGYLGRDETRPYFILQSPSDIALSEGIIGAPTQIFICTTDKTIIRHLFMGRYGGETHVNISDFLKWFLDVINHYSYARTSDIKIVRSFKQFERIDDQINEPPCRVYRRTLTKVNWHVTISRDATTD